MRRVIGFIIACVWAVGAFPAHAAAETWMGLQGGVGMPFGDFADVASTGFNLGVTGDHMFGKYWALGGEISVHGFGGNDDLEKRLSAMNGVPTDFTFRTIPLVAHAKYMLPANGKLAPFLKYSLGVYQIRKKEDAGIIQVDKSQTKFGFQIGAGANFRSTATIAYGGELAYHYISGAVNDNGENKAGNLLTLRAQLMFGFGGGGAAPTPPPTK
jgi:opacity protein-like surface antigen